MHLVRCGPTVLVYFRFPHTPPPLWARSPPVVPFPSCLLDPIACQRPTGHPVHSTAPDGMSAGPGRLSAMPRDDLVMSPQVREALEDVDLDATFSRGIPERLTCVVCGHDQDRSPERPMNVVLLRDATADAARSAGDAFVLQFAHPSCSASKIVAMPGVLSRIGEDGVNARAQFGQLGSDAVLVWETVSQASGLHAGTADTTDMLLAGLLASGLPLAGRWEPQYAVPVDGWAVQVWRGKIIVRQVGMPAAYIQDLNDEVLRWLAIAGQRVLVLTGADTGLLGPTGATPETLDGAARAGRLLGGWMSVVRGRLPDDS